VKAKLLLGSTNCRGEPFPVSDGATERLVGPSTHQALENSALGVECCLCLCAGVLPLQEARVCSDEKTHWMFLDPTKKCSLLLSKSFPGTQRHEEGTGEAEIVEGWGQSAQ